MKNVFKGTHAALSRESDCIQLINKRLEVEPSTLND